MIENIAVLGRREAPIERHHHRAEAGAGEGERDHLRTIGAEKRNPIAAPDTGARAQAAGDAPDHRVERGVTKILAIADDRGPVRGEGRPALDPCR